MKKIAILGSTGSIGTQTLEIVRNNGDLEVTALAAGNNIDLLEQQIREFRPKLAAVWKEERAAELKSRVRDLEIEIVSGMDGLLSVAAVPESEILVTAIVGMIGILPTIEAIKAGKDIALANKETLVTAGHIIMPLAKERGVSILPVDSEHSAIFQSLQGGQRKALHKILLTASGGPFRGKKREELKNIQVEDALKHPNWEMGRKITIDSSTMVNKGRPGSDRGEMAVRRHRGPDPGGRTAPEHHPLYGGVRGRRGHRAARDAGYEAPDPVCPVLSGAAVPAGGQAGLCGASADHV